MKKVKTYTEFLNEAKQHPGFVKVIKKYIELTEPGYSYEDSDIEWLNNVEDEAKKNGYYDDLETAAIKAHYGRDKSVMKMDPLEQREWWAKMNKDNAITKGGKLNKNVATGIKNRIKSDRKNK